MTQMTTRRAFLSGRVPRRDNPRMRPPGAVPGRFQDLCTRCGDCVATCPEGILADGGDGWPETRLALGACTFCGDCARACEAGALDPGRLADWPWRASIGTACLSLGGVTCRACQDACDEAAIRFRLRSGGRAEPLIDSAGCTGCGACAAICPVGAVAFQRSAPAERETVQ